MIQSRRYRLSFTFGGLLVHETRAIAAEYTAARDWELVRLRVMEHRVLQKTRSSTSFRYFREIRDRLSGAYTWEIELIAGRSAEDPQHHRSVRATENDIPLIILAVVSRHYRIIGDFIRDVLRKRIVEGLSAVDSSMFRSYMADLQPEHPELQNIADSTENKLVQVTMRVFKEAGIAAGRKEPYALVVPALSTSVKGLYCSCGTIEDYTHLLWNEKEISPCAT